MVSRRSAVRAAALLLAVASVFGVAVAARILPLLRGGGLRSYGSYDDSVYFASALGWVHGRWPYRDFLLLQPPGIVLALAPFAGLARWFGDSGGLAAARLGWMILGGLTAAGLVLLLWRTSRIAAVIAGLLYAFFWPATMVERVTYVEAPQNFLLVAALLLLRPFGTWRPALRAEHLAALVAGIALGLALSIKIWEIAPIVVLAGWLAYRRRRGVVLRFGLGVIVASVVVYLPFLLVARRAMWNMVVGYQLGRPRQLGWARRLVNSTGTTHLLGTGRFGPGLVLVLLGLLVTLVLAWRRPGARVLVVLLLVEFCVLMQSPPTHVHYGAFIGVPLAILVGVAVREVIGMLGRLKPALPRRLTQGVIAAGAVAMLAGIAYAPATDHAGKPVPGRRFVAAVAAVRGCVSYDQPSQALSLNVVSHDLERGCPFVVDLGAVSHWTHLQPAPGGASRGESRALNYLRSGSASLLYRYPPGPRGSDPHDVIGCWKTIARHHRLRLVKPGAICRDTS